MELDQWAITLSSKDGCFQAHLEENFSQPFDTTYIQTPQAESWYIFYLA